MVENVQFTIVTAKTRKMQGNIKRHRSKSSWPTASEVNCHTKIMFLIISIVCRLMLYTLDSCTVHSIHNMIDCNVLM